MTMVDRTLFKLIFIMCCYESEQMKVTQNCKGYDCLKAYVEKSDLAYTWEDTGHRLVVDDFQGRGEWTGYFLNFTSQQWLTPDDTSRS